MAEIYWPAGVADDPLQEGLQYGLRENGASAKTDSGQDRLAPRFSAADFEISAGYPMSGFQFKGLWLPWWQGAPSSGGCLNGTVAFWLRDPITRIPFKWTRIFGEKMRPERDGLGFIVWLSLLRLP